MENRQNDLKNQPKKKNNILVKTAIIGVVSGLIGGGISYAAFDQINNAQNNQAQTSISSNNA